MVGRRHRCDYAPNAVATDPLGQGHRRRGQGDWNCSVRVFCCDAGFGVKSFCGRVARVHNFLLRGDLHSVAQALDTSEHCDRWRGRGLPADDWLGRCNGWDQLRKRADVRFDFCLDSTAFLGSGAVHAQ